MRTPLKEPNNFVSAHVLKSIIPPDIPIKSYAFFSGQMEFPLLKKRERVTFLTNKIAIYDFWKHLLDKPEVVALHAEAMHKQTTQGTIEAYQRELLTYREPYMRAAIFYLLNAYSDDGSVSFGTYDINNYNPLSLRRLRELVKNPYEIELKYYPATYVEEGLHYAESEDLIFIPVGVYNAPLLITGLSEGFDTYAYNHQQLHNTLSEMENKFVLCYKYSPRLRDLYARFNLTYVDKYGNSTRHHHRAEDVIITNF
jgi:hypothetical protein